MRRFPIWITMVLCISAPVTAAMYKINNPADKISNPAANIYNPATRMNNPDPLSPPVQKLPPAPAEATAAPNTETPAKPLLQTKPVIPQKTYNFKSVKTYITAAKKAFVQDDIMEFLAVTEDALRRINAGTLKASERTRQKLIRYKLFGTGLLESVGN